MVSPTYLPSSEGRRYPTRGAGPYPPPYQEHRTSGFPPHELRSNVVSSSKETTDESSSSQRKRIAVACGRCRKRKIRCSGDDGSGQPCTNCKNAGYEPCQFLRVSSQETPMRGEGFPYTIDLSRQLQTRGTAVPGMLPNINPYAEGMVVGDGVPFRQGPSYAYNNKQYYQVPGYAAGYPGEESATDYPMYPTYTTVQDPNYMMGYRVGGSAAGIKPNGVYVEAEPDYGFSTGPPPPQTTSTLHRSAQGPETTNYPFPGVGVNVTGLQHQGERFTPPTTHRGSLPGPAPYLYRNDSLSSAYTKHPQISPVSTPSATSPVGEQVGYGGYDTSGVASSSSSSSYPTASPLRGHNDMYTTSTSSPTGMMPHTPASPQRLAAVPAEMTYRYTDTTRQVEGLAPSMVMNGEQQGYMTQGHGHHESYMGQVDHCPSDDEALTRERKMSRAALSG